MRRALLLCAVLGMLATLTTSCQVERFIGEDEYVMYRNRYDITCTDTTADLSTIHSALAGVNNYALQQPNSRLLGMRLKLLLYTLSNPDNDNWLNRFMRRNGEAPVIFDETDAERTITQIAGLLNSKGSFGSTIDYTLQRRRGRNVVVDYHIKATPRYIIDEVSFNAETDTIRAILRKNQHLSLLQSGDPYDQDLISKERDRIALQLQNEGFFRATKELITFIVDTTYSSNRMLSIDVMVHNPDHKEDLEKYLIGEVYIYPDASSSTYTDTTIYTQDIRGQKLDYTFIHNGKMPLSAKTISQTMMLFPRRPYRPRHITNTYNSLLTLRNFKYIDITFQPRENENIVDTYIRMLKASKRKMSASIELSNASPIYTGQESGNFITNGNFGLEGILNYQNKNLFGGAEQFNIDATFLVELPKLFFKRENSDFHNTFSAFEGGLDFSLDIPQFLLPFTSNIVWQRNRPHTIISLGGSYQYRHYFERALSNISYGYSWRHNREIQHQLFPLELTFVRFFDIDQDFLDRLSGANGAMLKYQYSDHFVMNAKYNYTYNSQQFGTRANFNYLNASIETAGNLLEGAARLGGVPLEDGTRKFLGVPYSQYIRLNIDTKRYFYHGKKSTFVTRLLAGIGIPYNNSISMPYEKSFFGGGPTTMRAWQIRKLGPGSYHNPNDKYDRIGDLQLTINLEERFPIASIFEGTVFADMGNVWLTHQTDLYPGGNFKWNRFYKEIAVGIGAGLRMNVSILTIRFDFAIPLYDPGYETSYQWRPPYWKFNQIVTNVGINYPF